MNFLELTEKIISEHHITALMITHNLNNAKKFGSRVIMMENGKIKLDSPKDKINFNSI